MIASSFLFFSILGQCPNGQCAATARPSPQYLAAPVVLAPAPAVVAVAHAPVVVGNTKVVVKHKRVRRRGR